MSVVRVFGVHPQEIADQVITEMLRAERKHPNYPGMTNPVRCINIITEELGEAAREANDLTRPGDPLAPDEEAEIRARLLKETVETAATCFRLIKAIKESERGN